MEAGNGLRKWGICSRLAKCAQVTHLAYESFPDSSATSPGSSSSVAEAAPRVPREGPGAPQYSVFKLILRTNLHRASPRRRLAVERAGAARLSSQRVRSRVQVITNLDRAAPPSERRVRLS